jgi:hypothetical protein
MKEGQLIDISESILCPLCGEPLNFKWESRHSDRKIATCCKKEYGIKPSKFYEVEYIINE